MLKNLTAPAHAGIRPANARSRRVEGLAAHFNGLPEGVTRWRLMAAARGAARRLGLTASMLALLEHYVDRSHDQDWTAGAEPVIGWPLIDIAEALGKSERQIRNLERALAERGLLCWRDSGNHHRKGRRDRSGALVYAYGPSLAPMGARALEIIALAGEARRELAELRRTRMEISALRRRIRAEIAIAPPHRAREIGARYDEIAPRAPSGSALDPIRDALRDLVAMIDARDAKLIDAENQAKPAPLPEIRRRHLPETPVQTFPYAERTPITLRKAIRSMGEETRALMQRDKADWSGFIEAGRLYSRSQGVSERDWGAACASMGRDGAALCAIILEHGLQRRTNRIQAPQRYWRGMMRRAEYGRLDVEASLSAILRRKRDQLAPRYERHQAQNS